MRVISVSASMLLDLIGLPETVTLVGVQYHSGDTPRTSTLYLIVENEPEKPDK